MPTVIVRPMLRLCWPAALAVLASLHQLVAADVSQPLVERGKQLYQQHCFICHQASGQGAPGIFPPLAKSDFLMADKPRSIRILCEGLNGKITVNGRDY